MDRGISRSKGAWIASALVATAVLSTAGGLQAQRATDRSESRSLNRGESVEQTASGRALEVLTAARHALGSERFFQAKSIRLRVEGATYWEGQGASPRAPVRVREVEREDSFNADTEQFVRIQRTFYRDGTPSSCSRFVAGPDGGLLYDCLAIAKREAPTGTSDAVIGAWRARQVHGLLEEAWSRRETLRWLEARTLAAGTVHAFSYLAEDGSRRIWYVDAESHLPVRLEWAGHDSVLGGVPRLIEFDDYRDVGGWHFPFRVVRMVPGGQSSEERTLTVTTNEAVAEMPAEVPASAEEWAPFDAPAARKLTRLSENILLVENAIPTYNVLLIRSVNGITVVDAPGNHEVGAEILAIAAREFPGASIRRAILTHFHSDHVEAIAPLVQAGAELVTTPGAVRFTRELAGSPDEVAIEAVQGSVTFGTGTSRIEVYAIDASPHADEMLLVYLPAERALFVADLFGREAGGHVAPAGPGTVAFLRAAEALELPIDAVVPAHGGVTSLEAARVALERAPWLGREESDLSAGGGPIVAATLATCTTDIKLLNHVAGWQVRWPGQLASAPVGTAEERRALLDRWAGVRAALRTDRRALEHSLRRGQSAPRTVVRRVVEQIDALLDGSRGAGLWSPAERAADAGFSDRWRRLVRSVVLPEIRAFRSFLVHEYLPAARDQPGLADSAGGAACYLDAVENWTGLRLRPEQIHETGRILLASLESELMELASPEYGNTVPRILARLRSEDLPESFGSRTQVVEHAEAALARARAEIPGWFGAPGDLHVRVRPIDEDTEASEPAGRYLPPDSPGEPGTYLINTGRPEERRLLSEVIAFHEGIPGHHLSFAAAAAAGRGAGGFDAGFLEGWAVYAERLADEMGLYSSRLDRIGMVVKQMWAASRLLVDPGLHVRGDSRERAIELMRRHTALRRAEIEIEVDRYAALPGQALAYALGYTQIRDLRIEAQNALGEDFDIREFHDLLLLPGIRPLPEVRQDVAEWVRLMKAPDGT